MSLLQCKILLLQKVKPANVTFAAKGTFAATVIAGRGLFANRLGGGERINPRSAISFQLVHIVLCLPRGTSRGFPILKNIIQTII